MKQITEFSIILTPRHCYQYILNGKGWQKIALRQTPTLLIQRWFIKNSDDLENSDSLETQIKVWDIKQKEYKVGINDDKK